MVIKFNNTMENNNQEYTIYDDFVVRTPEDILAIKGQGIVPNDSEFLRLAMKLFFISDFNALSFHLNGYSIALINKQGKDVDLSHTGALLPSLSESPQRYTSISGFKSEGIINIEGRSKAEIISFIDSIFDEKHPLIQDVIR